MTAPIPFKSSFLQTLQARGYIHQITHPEELDAAASQGIITAYIGYDATAPSLHIGNLITIMMLRRLVRPGVVPQPPAAESLECPLERPAAVVPTEQPAALVPTEQVRLLFGGDFPDTNRVCFPYGAGQEFAVRTENG